ncbi:MAG: DUF3604 domain-containing protein [Deltaproteobacteria bacterium]|nr:DUF3604 domain-containing protein [Deltaproteobacteria bacterium]
MKKALLAILALLTVAGIWLLAGANGWLGSDEEPGELRAASRPAATMAARSTVQTETARMLGAAPDKQILFGDFHVHTTFSFDAFLMSLPIAGGKGTSPPAAACDFARFCSALDFWSINDHAETLTPDLWDKTVESVRECNAAAGDPANPDLVTYLGWEWSHIGSTPENHYGHKNVVLRGLSDDEIPTRPIAARPPPSDGGLGFPFIGQALLATAGGERGRSFARFLSNASAVETCPDGVPVRDLPTDCRESAPTPEALFDKLDDWGHDSIVIPHGTAWGLYTPAGSDWRKQLPGHDPKRQTLVEIYSGHGNSEQLPPWRPVEVAADGALTCPAPKDGYLPSCWHAGTLVEAQCKETGESDDECKRRAETARANYVAASQAGWLTLPGYEASDWLNAGQAPLSMFQATFNYRPAGSAQYMLALRDFTDPLNPKRFDFGFIGSSDNHTARPGTGYKEFGRGDMTEGRGRIGETSASGSGFFGSSNEADAPAAESVPFVSSGESPLQLFEIERGSAYFVTGGLVAVHSAGRDRDAIWDALQRKEVYATSGRRTLLWFDLLGSDLLGGAASVPMGATTTRAETPRFRVRAIGSFEQKPDCPDDVVAALGEARVDHVCLGECYNPSDERRPITRIEIVRIRPQAHADEPLDGLVEDPWRVLPCPADGSGCVVEFADSEFGGSARDAVYYARAIEAPDSLIHGKNPLGCQFDEQGRCVEIEPCGANTPQEDDCKGVAEPRAWSSPIFVNHAGS